MKTRLSHSTRRFDSLEQEAFLGLWRTYDRLKTLEDELFARVDLTPQQYNLLRILCSDHPEAVRTLDLGGRLVSRAPDVTRMLDKLEQRGLIERDRSTADRRVVSVRITPAGKSLLDEIHGPLQGCHARQLGHLPRRDLELLIQLLSAARAPHEEPASSWP